MQMIYSAKRYRIKNESNIFCTIESIHSIRNKDSILLNHSFIRKHVSSIDTEIERDYGGYNGKRNLKFYILLDVNKIKEIIRIKLSIRINA